MSHILIVDDSSAILEYIEDMLTVSGHSVKTCSNGAEGLELLGKESFELIISDMAMPILDGFQMLEKLRSFDLETPIIMITGVGGVPDAVKAIKNGANDFITKPLNPDEFMIKVEKSLETVRLKRELALLKSSRRSLRGINILIGESASMEFLKQQILQVAPTNASIMVLGESGTGKELVAKAIHNESDRQEKAFIPVDCSTLTESIIESELFGHMKGAFTGADRTRKGMFEEAHLGTIFLDEIGNLSLQVQSKLLRFLQEREIKPVGSSKPMKVDVRIISATNADIRGEIEKGNFREDLYYRLSGIEMKVPPLREKLEDIPLLVEHFIDDFSRDLNRPITGMDRDALDLLMNREWKGNVRELEHMTEHAVILETKSLIGADTIMHVLPESREGLSGNTSPLQLSTAISGFEKKHILKVLKIANNNRAETARMLGISRSVLYDKMKKYGI